MSCLPGDFSFTKYFQKFVLDQLNSEKEKQLATVITCQIFIPSLAAYIVSSINTEKYDTYLNQLTQGLIIDAADMNLKLETVVHEKISHFRHYFNNEGQDELKEFLKTFWPELYAVISDLKEEIKLQNTLSYKEFIKISNESSIKSRDEFESR